MTNSKDTTLTNDLFRHGSLQLYKSNELLQIYMNNWKHSNEKNDCVCVCRKVEIQLWINFHIMVYSYCTGSADHSCKMK